MPLIPYNFQYDQEIDVVDDDHLEIDSSGDCTRVMWLPYVNETIYLKDNIGFPSLDDIALNTPSFLNHSDFGFSLGNYSEFFVFIDEYIPKDKYFLTFKVGEIEMSIGEVTPLAIWLYGGQYDEHFHPDLEWLLSIRMIGAEKENIESLLLHACINVHKEYGFILPLFNLSSCEYDDEEEGHDDTEIKQFNSHVVDIEPLRFYYRAMRATDNSDAFLQFYRVFEYYSWIVFRDDFAKLRWNSDISDKKLFDEIQNNRYEKDKINRLLIRVIEDRHIDSAKKYGLIKNSDKRELTGNLYNFRNALVHAKKDFRESMISESAFTPHNDLGFWRDLIGDLSFKILEHFGTRFCEPDTPDSLEEA